MKPDETPIAAAHNVNARRVDPRLLADKSVNRVNDIMHFDVANVTAETVKEGITIPEGAVVVRHQHRVARTDEEPQPSPMLDAAQDIEVIRGIEDVVGSPMQLDDKRTLGRGCSGVVEHTLAAILRLGGEHAVGEK